MSRNFKGSTSARFVRNQGQSNMANSYALSAQQILKSNKIDEIDSMMGFERYTAPQFSGNVDKSNFNQIPGRMGWLTNMHPTVINQDSSAGSSGSTSVSGVDFYFLDEEGGSFKSTVIYDPYFFIAISNDSKTNDVEEFLKKHLETCLKSIEVIEKEDLTLDNHLVGLQRTLIKLSFINSNQLFEARRLLRPILTENTSTKSQRDIYKNSYGNTANNSDRKLTDAKQWIEDIREYDVPYHVRVSIDKDIRVGKWYKVCSEGLIENTEKVAFADPVVLAFDIETTKAPLKFPVAEVDQVMMISYMIDGEGYLITNREIISEDIEDFEYTPKPEYNGQFTIFNEANELALLQRFFEHIRDVRPTVIATFNGDFFDWPFVETRAKINGLNMYDEIGFAPDAEGEYKSPYCSHMDCYRWVKRDSYLPQGSQGLKAVTQAKLGYNPIELDPELMTPYAYEKPQELSEYSVSDAVATYYLYMKYVHPFIFSLCTIIPLNPDEVLRKGTGTLCEMLLMVQAYKGNILLPNKHTDPLERFYDGHLLETETYVGGHVESLEAGVFRSDLKSAFKVDPTAIDEILEDLPKALKFSIETENHSNIDEVTNFDEIKEKITQELLALKKEPKRNEYPLIYHVDVASMYPNIMATNRLQPDSIKTERYCASCDFNRPGKTCARKLKWAWRGEYFPAKMDEYNMIKRALQNETFPNKNKYSKKPYLTFDELSYTDQVLHIKKRLTEYSKKVYHRTKVSEVVEREAIVCQRENPFYVNTVRSFRDRRYEFKGLAKTWKGKVASIDPDDHHKKDEAKKLVVLYDSLQLAHKVILNSFYGYVMRKGSRWYSMEMAGITCLTGATIIQMARSLVERIGRPLELDTDGIWCILPKSFPENYFFELKNGKKLFMSYPCSMLNYKVHQQFTNHQYQELVDPIKHKYKTHSENSIFFEVDGPYKAMILPTSKEEGKGIKKRYAVFNNDGSLAELKGFELKRRGELQLIKNFQSDIFNVFLEGDTLESCYKAVADVANRWLDVLDTKGSMLEDEDLIGLICENRSMSKTLKEYEGQKSTSITTARRLGQFLGEDMVKDKGLQCKYIISNKPHGAPVAERAIPVAIFSSDIAIKRSFLRRWTADPSLEKFDIRGIIDWGYYRERLGSTIQKIITMPAALQDIPNPVPRVEHPDWLKKKIAIKEDKFKQTSLNKFFNKASSTPAQHKIQDIEDLFRTDEETEDALNKMSKIAKAKSMKQNGKRRRAKNDTIEEPLVLPTDVPSMEEDYVAWLEYSKIKWKLQQRDRYRRTQLFGSTNKATERSALGNMMRRQAESYANSTWEIIQYKSTIEPGILDVYVSINGKIQILKFNIPRIIYVKFKTDTMPISKIKHCQVEKVNATLPNIPGLSNSKTDNLFRLILPESVYLDEIENRTSILNDENVLGIFESTIPAKQRAIMELGSAVSFNSTSMGSLGRGLQTGFDLKNLSMTDNHKYLRRYNGDISYVLHFSTNIGYELFIVYRSWNNSVNLFVLKPSTHAQNVNETLLVNIFKQYYNTRREKKLKFSRFGNVGEDATFTTESFIDYHKLIRRLNNELGKLKDERGQQFLLLLQSPYIKKVLSSVKNFKNLPIIEWSSNDITLPQLNWQSTLINKVIKQLLFCGSWIDDMIAVAQYSNIPLGNLQLDNMSYVIDILYARRLKHENIVLWWNEDSPLPDHAGIQKDYDPTTSWVMNDLSFPEINIPNVYDKTILEININNLIINTILGSNLINEAEGSDLAGASMSTSLDFNEGTSSGTFVQDAFNENALNVLKVMLKDWWESALEDNPTADLLINMFINWVQGPNSNLFDGYLRYHIHNVTKKSTLQLMNEFNSLGSNVFYADRNKLLVQTNKYSPENCYAYSQYMLKSIKVNPMFKYIDLKIERYWNILIWMDKWNFSGLACNEVEDKDVQNYEAYSQWQIKKTLPVIFQSEFDDWMVIILDSMLKTKNQYLEKAMGTQRATQIQAPIVQNNEDETDSSLATFTKSFSYPLIKRIKKLFRNQQEFILDPQYSEDYRFPDQPGSYLELKNPLLELVKYLCHAMMLSKSNILEVRQLRKDLLTIFEMREFSKEATFRNPTTSLTIDGFLCEHCSHITNIDFCKDDLSNVFTCVNCSSKLDKLLLQEHLIQKFCSTIELFYTQDLHCAKCHKVKDDYMSTHCNCSGKWEVVVSANEIGKEIEIFKQVCSYYDFSLLQDAITQLSSI